MIWKLRVSQINGVGFRLYRTRFRGGGGACDESKVQVGGIKAPATRLKRRDLVQKLSKLEAKIAKLKELKKIEKCKRW